VPLRRHPKAHDFAEALGVPTPVLARVDPRGGICTRQQGCLNRLTFCRVLRPDVGNAPSLLLILTVVGPSGLPFAMITAKPPLVSFRGAQEHGKPLSEPLVVYASATMSLPTT
jgi:hypothetical protein